MSCLITGSAGFIGRHLLQRLVRSREYGPVRAYDIATAPGPLSSSANRSDIRDQALLQWAMRDCDVVFHLAAEATVLGCERDPVQAAEVNATGTLNVLRAAGKAGVRRVVFASSREVYGDVLDLPVSESAPIAPKNHYGNTKATAEEYCREAEANLEVTILRLSNVYGPGDRNRVLPRFVTAALAGLPLTLYGGGQILDFVWIDTVVDAFVRAGFGAHVPGPVNIGSGTGIRILEAAKRVINLVNSSSSIVTCAARDIEVDRFIADIRLGQRELSLPYTSQPLDQLPAMISTTAATIQPHSQMSCVDLAG